MARHQRGVGRKRKSTRSWKSASPTSDQSSMRSSTGNYPVGPSRARSPSTGSAATNSGAPLIASLNQFTSTSLAGRYKVHLYGYEHADQRNGASAPSAARTQRRPTIVRQGWLQAAE